MKHFAYSFKFRLCNSIACVFLLLTSCHRSYQADHPDLVSIQIQDRNGMTETISQPDRLQPYQQIDFLANNPYKKVLRVFKQEGKLAGKITTYHPNGQPWQYLEALDMRAFGAYREWHSNGQLKIEANVIGGTADVGSGAQKNWLFDGKAQIWNETGRLQATIFYNKGALDGDSIHYYATGEVHKEMPYAQNELQGELIEYYKNGSIQSKTSYRRGIKNGASVGYWADSSPKWTETYQDGLLLNAQYFAANGQLVSEIQAGGGQQPIFNETTLEQMIEFRRGKVEGFVKIFFPNGELKTIYHLKNGQKQGEEIEYYSQEERENEHEASLRKISIPWEKDSISGIVKTWYKNGKLQSQKELSRNKKSGAAVGWYRDGGLMYMEEYEEDRLVKGQYYKKNHKEPVSSITNGTGIAALYDETGAFLRKVHYVKGKAVDPES